MNTTTKTTRLPFAKELLALSIAGLMAAPVAAQNTQNGDSQGATTNNTRGAATGMNTQGAATGMQRDANNTQSATTQPGAMNRSSQLSQGTADQQSQIAADNSRSQEFQSMDADRDNVLVWREIYVVMDPRIVAANLDQEQVFSQYDNDNDDALNEEEFNEFISGLEQSEIASARTEQSRTDTSELAGQQGGEQQTQTRLDAQEQSADQQSSGQNSAQQNAQAGANLDVNDNSEHGADQAIVLPDDGRYNQAGTASTSAVNPQRQQDEPALTSETQYRVERGDEMGSDENILGQGDDFAPEGEPRSANAGTNATSASSVTLEENNVSSQQAQTDESQEAMSQSQVSVTDNTEADAQAERQTGAQDLQTVAIETLQKKTVKNSAGEELGEVKNVVVNREKGEVGLVVTSGGVMGIGSKKLLAPAEELSLSEDELVWDTSKSSKELKESAKYQPEGYTEVSDQYETIEEVRQAGL